MSRRTVWIMSLVMCVIIVNSRPSDEDEPREHKGDLPKVNMRNPDYLKSGMVNGKYKTIEDVVRDCRSYGTRKPLETTPFQKTRTKFTKEQMAYLKAEFIKEAWPKAQKKQEISDKLNLEWEIVDVWFVNRRYRLKMTKRPPEARKRSTTPTRATPKSHRRTVIPEAYIRRVR